MWWTIELESKFKVRALTIHFSFSLPLPCNHICMYCCNRCVYILFFNRVWQDYIIKPHILEGELAIGPRVFKRGPFFIHSFSFPLPPYCMIVMSFCNKCSQVSIINPTFIRWSWIQTCLSQGSSSLFSLLLLLLLFLFLFPFLLSLAKFRDFVIFSKNVKTFFSFSNHQILEK